MGSRRVNPGFALDDTGRLQPVKGEARGRGYSAFLGLPREHSFMKRFGGDFPDSALIEERTEFCDFGQEPIRRIL